MQKNNECNENDAITMPSATTVTKMIMMMRLIKTKSLIEEQQTMHKQM